MSFIVSLFKYIILAICFIVLVAVALGVIAAADPNGPFGAAATPYALVIAFVILIMLILSLGGIAILISLHDRHREIAEGVDRIAKALDRAAKASDE